MNFCIMPKNDWFIGKQDSDRGRIITRGRIFRGNQRNTTLYPMRVEVQWLYKGTADGMPTEEETAVTDKVMNLLTDRLEDELIAWLTAVHTGGRQAVFVYYTRSVEDLSNQINATFGEFPLLPVKIGATEDKNWKEYNRMLESFGITYG